MKSKYILKLNNEEMKDIGFKYDFYLQEYILEFPVFKYGRKPTIICKLWINEENFEVTTNVYDENGRLYPSYYNRQYGKSKVVEIIDKNIERVIKKLKTKEKKGED